MLCYIWVKPKKTVRFSRKNAAAQAKQRNELFYKPLKDAHDIHTCLVSAQIKCIPTQTLIELWEFSVTKKSFQ